MVFLKKAFILLLFCVLSACGGGGSDSEGGGGNASGEVDSDGITILSSLPPPLGLTYSQKGYNAISLRWGRLVSTTNNVEVSSVAVYINGEKVGAANSRFGFGTEHLVEDLQPGTAYDFQVAYFGTQAYYTTASSLPEYRSVRSELSASKSITTKNLPTQAPFSSIQGLEINKLTASSVKLSWGKSQDEIGGYNIYKLTSGGSEKIGSENAFTTSFENDSNITFDTEYTYQVSAFNNLGESPKSNITFTTLHEARVPADPSALILGEVTRNAVDIHFQDNADNEDGYLIFESKSEAESLILDPGAVCRGEALSSCTIKNLTANTEYTLYLQAYTLTELSEISSKIIRSTAIPIPVKTAQ